MSGDILLISTADWDHPVWTNKQHVAVELARAGRRVLYVDSPGVRAARLDRRDFRRLARRLWRGVRPPRQVRPGLWVCSPLALPGGGATRAARALNRLMLKLSLAWAQRLSGVRPQMLWTYSPLTTELLDLRRFGQVVYHAVDDIAEQPGMPAQALRRAEAVLVRRADQVFVTSPRLRDQHVGSGARACTFMPNVADAEHFGRAMAADVEVPADLADLPGPRIGFVGAISGYKLDLALICAVARLRPGYSFVLIGPEGEGEPDTDLSALDGLANLHRLGWRAYQALPAYLAGLDVAMLPAAANRYTAAMFPMKFFEYLAAGRPVVTTPLPALADYAALALVAGPDPQAFADALDAALAGEGPSLAERLSAACAHTYAARTRAMLDRLEAAQPDMPQPAIPQPARP